MDNFQEKINMTFFDEKLDIEENSFEALNLGKTVMVTIYNPSTARSSIMSFTVPHDQIQSFYFLIKNLKTNFSYYSY